jgi:hypothetical protein
MDDVSNHLSPDRPPELRAELAALLRPAPALELHLVASYLRPGQLSFRAHPEDRSWRAVFEALEAAGFQAGDVVRVTRISR